MPIFEDAVNKAVAAHLRARGYTGVKYLLGNARGWDVSGICPNTGRTLVVESKGEARTGSQLARSWNNVASALLTALNERYGSTDTDAAIALPHTNEYLGRMEPLRPFFSDQKIAVFWVRDDEVSDIWI